jgi:uncharacterized protein YbaP (TraB family)
MMLKYLFLSITIVAFLRKNNAQVVGDSKNDYSLLWQVSKINSNQVSYLFGSMHSNDPEVFNFPDSVYSAFMKSDLIAVETDVTALFDTYDVRLEVIGMELFSKDRDLINVKQASKTIYGNEDGRPQFLDAYLQQNAHCLGKEVLALETMEEQFAISKKIKSSTRAAVNRMLYNEEIVKKAYLEGKIEDLYRMLMAQYKGMEESFDELIVQRNIRISERLDSVMENKTVFCCVGAGHLAGEKGLLSLLKKKGYLLRMIPYTKSGDTFEAKTNFMKNREVLVQHARYLFELPFPGKAWSCESENEFNMIFKELGQGNTYELTISSYKGNLPDLKNQFDFRSEIIFGKNLQNISYIQGIVNDLIHGPQWKRIYVKNGFSYQIICYGGNKFMRSNRPKTYFDKLIIW